MLSWAKQFNIFCFLDNCGYNLAPHRFECLLAAGVRNAAAADSTEALDNFIKKGNWYFGHLGYEFRNAIQGLPANTEDRIGFGDCFFFEPETVLRMVDDTVVIEGPETEAVYHAILSQQPASGTVQPVQIQQRLTKEAYIGKIEKLQQHILRGDCYEINFCQEFFAENALIDPSLVYAALTKASPNPFSAFYKKGDQYLLCASPERFLFKEGGKIICQPMKGTIGRDHTDAMQDDALRTRLVESSKDRSENVMIVDLVRNDLSRVCKDSSVVVDELFGVYPFPLVHQMISTVRGELKEDISFGAILTALFPMGSMTGAPKKRVMELIDTYENGPRGLFSGTVGYINPDGDFDFNVVIRSLMYNAASGYLSYQAGSGITIYSNPELEWEECLVKGAAIKKVLTTASTS